MPRVALDGELWTRRGIQQEASNLMRTNNEMKWNLASFCAFDVPEVNKPFEDRISYLKSLPLNKYVNVVEMIECKGRDHLKEMYENIVRNGGEGVMLREPGSYYKSGRSTTLAKYKVMKHFE